MKKPKKIEEKHTVYLSKLRDSGKTNMWDAVSYLEKQFPDLSKSLGKKANTEGVYRARAGGSPAARPISLIALANLVMESIIKITVFP